SDVCSSDLDAEHFATTGTFEDRIGQGFGRDTGVVGDDFGQHLLHVDDFHQLLVHLGDGGEVVLATGGAGWRQHLLPVEVEDAVDAAHQERLNRTVVLGHDDGAALIRYQRPQPDGARQVDHRQRLPTQIHHATDRRMAVRHQGHLRQLNDFLHLEHVDREFLPTREAEHQDFQAILPYQPGTLVDRIKHAGHSGSL